MSTMADEELLRPSLGRHSTTFNAGSTKIVLLDHTEARDELTRSDSTATDNEREDAEAVTTPLHKKLTSGSLGLQSVKDQVARQKYKRYHRDRYDLEHLDNAQSDTDSNQILNPQTEPSEPQTRYLERTRTKAKKLLKRKKGLGQGKDKEDTVIDILWENQRGSFLFGVPRYSANSLLPSDPKPWQNAQFRTSPVDIRNAQVPDPSWEWIWKSWYVDMSRDVDEEGWEYSLAFKINFSWHGNHPWFHSFVRRRRWLRMRSRKKNANITSSTKQNPHDLASEYFTIHPQRQMTSDTDIRRTSIVQSKSRYASDEPEISNIGELMRALRSPSLDREKLVTVRRFLHDGREEMRYMSERMSDIMSMFIYQNSRREILSILLNMRESISESEGGLGLNGHGDGGETERSLAKSAVSKEDLDRSIEAAREEIQKLEYWSDIKDVQADDGNNVIEKSDKRKMAFSSKQDAQEPGNRLHIHPEHGPSRQVGNSECKDTEIEDGPSSKPAQTQNSNPMQREDSTDLEHYVTAAESESDLTTPSLKGKRQNTATLSKSRPLGGVDEEELD